MTWCIYPPGGGRRRNRMERTVHHPCSNLRYACQHAVLRRIAMRLITLTAVLAFSCVTAALAQTPEPRVARPSEAPTATPSSQAPASLPPKGALTVHLKTST